MAKKQQADAEPTAAPTGVKVRVLSDCAYGISGSVGYVPEADLQQAVDIGLVDSSAGAVAYAESLRQPTDEPAAVIADA